MVFSRPKSCKFVNETIWISSKLYRVYITKICCKIIKMNNEIDAEKVNVTLVC